MTALLIIATYLVVLFIWTSTAELIHEFKIYRERKRTTTILRDIHRQANPEAEY